MARTLTPERQKLKQEAISLRYDYGWSDRRIAAHLDVARRTIDGWVGNNSRIRVGNNSTNITDQEGLSQGAIGKELGVQQKTISRWLSENGNSKVDILTSKEAISQNVLAKVKHPRYLVVCQSVEKFRPPDGS